MVLPGAHYTPRRAGRSDLLSRVPEHLARRDLETGERTSLLKDGAAPMACTAPGQRQSGR